jgi:hypothetical protein
MTAIGKSVYNPKIVVDFTSLGNWIPGNVTVSYVHINALVWLLIAMYNRGQQKVNDSLRKFPYFSLD